MDSAFVLVRTKCDPAKTKADKLTNNLLQIYRPDHYNKKRFHPFSKFLSFFNKVIITAKKLNLAVHIFLMILIHN